MTAAAMPRYFFDTFDNEIGIADPEGMELPGRDEARREAIRTLPFMALDVLPDGPNRQFKVEVRDEGGARLFEAQLSFSSRWLDDGL